LSQYFLRILLISLVSIVFSKSSHAETAGALQKTFFAAVSNNNTQTPDNVSAIVQDQRGFIWIASVDGLYRYDGREFKRFSQDPTDPTSLPDNIITSMQIVDKQQLLISTLRGGIFWFDTITENITPIIATGNDLSSIRIESLYFEQQQQRLWIGSYNGLYQLSLKTKQLVHYSHNPLDELTIPGRLVYALLKDRANQIWIGTDSGLAMLNPETQEFKQFSLTEKYQSSISITALYLDSDGSTWVGTERSGLFHITNAGSKVTNLNLSNSKLYIRDIRRMSSGDLWIASNSGVYVIPSFSVEPIHHATTAGDNLSIGDNDTQSLFEDNGKLVWIGTSKGIYISAPEITNFGRLLHLPFSATGLSHAYVSSIIENSKGEILIATQRGIDIFDAKNNLLKRAAIVPAKHPLNPKIHQLFLDNQRHVWIGDSQGHVSVLDENYNLIKSLSLSKNLAIKVNPVLFFYQQKNGQLWIGTEHKIIRINPTNFQIDAEFNIGGPHILERVSSQTMIEDNSGFLWFATRGNGLIKYNVESDSSDVFLHISADLNSISQDTINDLFIDESGSLWIATTNGLNKISQLQNLTSKPVFEKWLENDGLQDADIRGIAVDASGWLWLSTASGISRLNISNQTVENFSEKNGLQNSVFNSGAILQSKNGNLYFGGNNGVAQILPDNFKKNLHPPEVVITEISIRQGVWTSVNKKSIKLAYNQNDIRFKISALDYFQPESNHFKYRLVGFQDEWIDNQSNPIIGFTNLPGGKFTLEVNASNSDGVWSKTPSNLNFSVDSPWWLSFWAYLIYFVIFVSTIVIFVYSHRKKLRNERKISQHLRRNDRLKDEFLAVISHELRTPLTGIIGITESIMEGSSGTQNKRTMQGLSLISESGKRLSSLVNEILDFKKLTHDSLQLRRQSIDLESLLRVVAKSCEILLANKPVTLNISVAENVNNVFVDSNRLQQIIYNLIGNAIKFTEKGRVTVSASVVDGRVEVTVEDTGIGIAESNIGKIFKPFEQIEPAATRKYGGSGLGLSITSKLIELHGSKLQASSTLGVGSKFWFSLEPTANDFIEVVPSLTDDFESVPSLEHEIIIKSEISDVENSIVKDDKLILVADDETVNRKVICDFLQLTGYQTIQASNGKEALQLVGKHQFDLIILDVMMPQLSGFDVCKELRRQYTAIELPILLISASRDSINLITGLDAGANDYISKPVDRNVLLARVKTLLLLRQVSEAQKLVQQESNQEEIINRLSRYFPKPLVDKLLLPSHTSGFEASRRLITVVFADLVGFTELTDRFEAEIITDLLNQFITKMNQIVEAHNGVLNEVLGDGLVILFGAPVDLTKQQQAVEAINLSIEMQHTMQQLGQQWLKQGLDHNVKLRIGLHQDFATVGNIGSDNLIAYRAIGTGVNLASRLQTECEPGKILVSYPLYAQTKDMFNYQKLEEMQFKGFNHAHRVCELDPNSQQE
jgi:signal transduction histidine kinase/ligand-binding sensor domain-containing protein/class 3 adenylate cyclase